MIQIIVWKKLDGEEQDELLNSLSRLNSILCHGQIGDEFFKDTITKETDILIISRDESTRKSYTTRPSMSKTLKRTKKKYSIQTTQTRNRRKHSLNRYSKRKTSPMKQSGSIRGFVSIKGIGNSYYINLVCRAPSARIAKRSNKSEDPGKSMINKVKELAEKNNKIHTVTLSALPHVIGYYYKVFGYRIDTQASDISDRNEALKSFLLLLKTDYNSGSMEQFLEEYKGSYSKLKKNNSELVKQYNILTLGKIGKQTGLAKKIDVDGLHMTLQL